MRHTVRYYDYLIAAGQLKFCMHGPEIQSTDRKFFIETRFGNNLQMKS